jgi:formamidopyrimidine-DNA glycosylase
MPELPEVESVRQTLMPQIQGRVIAGVRVGQDRLARPDPRAFKRGLQGRRVEGSARRGKLLMLSLTGGAWLGVRLGMTGQLILAQGHLAADHVHVTISFDDHGPSLNYRDARRFGNLTFFPDAAALQAGALAKMGPDALGLAGDIFAARLAAKRSPIKAVLLDQAVLAGVGNIYADEALHRAGISPYARPAELAESQLLRLGAALQETLQEALAQGGSSVRNFIDAEGRAGTFQHAHRVYQRAGQPCPACGATVEKTVLGGRSTHFCPACQPSASGRVPRLP